MPRAKSLPPRTLTCASLARCAVRDSFNITDPHFCIDAWTTHARHLIYATAEDNVLIIQTDFSAQYSHKAAWTNTCEHPPTSNIDVFVVTRVVIDKVAHTRTYVTDVWRIFSAAKGSSAFHNECLRQITEFYRGVIALVIVYVCTDGCRGQYKGKRNFYKISTFASEHSKDSCVLGPIPMVHAASYETSHAPTNKDLAAVVDAVLAGAVAAADATVMEATISRSSIPPAATSPRTLSRRRAPTVRAPSPPEVFDVVLRHFFACGHHFKGPHDGYGKDAKFMPKTAERHQRARIATTFDLYNFNATYLSTPRVNVLASEVVVALSLLFPEKLAPLDPSHLPGDWTNMLDHLNLPQGSRCLPVDVEPPVVNPTVDPPVANTTPDATPATTDPTPEEPDMEGLEADDLNARPTVSAHEEDEDSEAEDAAGDFDFEFDEAGSRVLRPEQLEEEGASASPSSSSTADAGSASAESPATPPAAKAAKRSKKARVVRMTMKESGCEEHKGGEVRVVTQRAKEPGIFTANAYHWLYYAVYPASGVTIIPVGQKCTSPSEAHSILDPAENVDADSVPNSNSTCEFAGVDPKQAGLLFL